MKRFVSVLLVMALTLVCALAAVSCGDSSSSGKTTFSHRLSTQLIACGLRPHAIATDNYFRNRADTPPGRAGRIRF